MRRTALLTLLLTGSLFVAFAAQASGARTITANPARSWGVTYLGSWHVTAHPEYGKAVYALGEPSHVDNPGIPHCRVAWGRLGLEIQFTSFGGATSCADSLAQSAVVKGPSGRRAWRTQRGLRVGDSLRRLRRLYPNAKRKPSARVVVYQRNPQLGDGAIVTAVIRKRRVASLRLWLGGAGD